MHRPLFLSFAAFFLSSDLAAAQPAVGLPVGPDPIKGVVEYNSHDTDRDVWLHVIENHRSETIIASAGMLLCAQGPPAHYFEHDAFAYFALLGPIPPGGKARYQIADSEARCHGIVDTLVFADGSHLGNEQHYTRIVATRRGLALQLPVIIQSLKEVALGQRSARALASQMTSTADTIPIGAPINWEDAARRNVLLETANLLVRQAFPAPIAFPPMPSLPSVEKIVHTFHVQPEQAHAAAIMQMWVAWDNEVKAYAPATSAASLPGSLSDTSLGYVPDDAHAAPHLKTRPDTQQPAPSTTIPQTRHCPLKLVAVRDREFGAGASSSLYIRYSRVIKSIDVVFYGPPAYRGARPLLQDELPDVQQTVHDEESRKNVLGTSIGTEGVRSVRWFEVTTITFPHGKSWHSSPESRCIYIPLDPKGGTDWQSVLETESKSLDTEQQSVFDKDHP
ncbi:hypothetical protein FTW19_04090 [Terriglobus albidus]|uniref:Uncharacterized protein n=1 Tax=Terriglobus albidus TaxID=1592106 RepID=A0A5B9E9G9_9BACT|nr:hypothetical protein [Terriglobus albidus]QEE27260.1 hypothetical protein FTW19_04090 [Terriglobus albidus]